MKKKGKQSFRTSIATRAIHGNTDQFSKGPVVTPIYQTSTFRFGNTKNAIQHAKGDPSVYAYTRYHNPTVQDAEEKISLISDCESSAVFSSGMAAITSAIIAFTKSGCNIVSTPALYGGVYRWMRDELPRYNIDVRFVNTDRLSDIPKIADERTALVYFETPTNPTLDIVDIEAVVRYTRDAENKTKHRIFTLIDNTFATILNQNPSAFGVDLVLESATKYLSGHSDLLAGVVSGKEMLVDKVKAIRKQYGGCIDPFAAYLLARSLMTFELRVQRQNKNAFRLAKALEKHKNVNRVLYPGLQSHPRNKIAKKQMTGFGGMITIEVKSKKYTPAKAAAKVCDNLKIAVNAVSLGGVETLVSMPVYSSHVFMSDSELKRHGVTPGMIRISAGIEGIQDLISDFDDALKKI